MPKKKDTKLTIAEIEAEMKRKCAEAGIKTELDLCSSESDEEAGKTPEIQNSQDSVITDFSRLRMSPRGPAAKTEIKKAPKDAHAAERFADLPSLEEGQLGCMGLMVHQKKPKTNPAEEDTYVSFVSQKCMFIWSFNCPEEEFLKAEDKLDEFYDLMKVVPGQHVERFRICSSEGFSGLPNVIGGSTRGYCDDDLPFMTRDAWREKVRPKKAKK